MKRLMTLALCMFMVCVGIWSYTTNIHNSKITSQKQTKFNDPVIKILNENIKLKKEAELTKNRLNNSKIKDKILKTKVNEETKIPIYNIPLDIKLQRYIYKLCKEKDIPYEITLAIIKTESDFNPNLIHKNSNGTVDKGLMQINSVHLKWCKELGISDLLDPYQNVDFGTTMLSNIYNKHKSIHKTMMVYNMGTAGAERNWKVGRGSTVYSRKVVNNINIIKYNK